jgi:hypothetical protein
MKKQNIVGPVQHPPKCVTPKGTALPPGGMLGRDLTKSIVICMSCFKPIYVLYFDMITKPKALGDYKVPEKCNEPCPKCKAPFCKINEKTGAAQYLTNLGLV